MAELHLSPSEIDSLKERLNELESQRLEVAEEIKAARAQGDLRENSAYHAAKEKQAFLESQIRDLQDRLSRAQPVERDETALEEVQTGQVVTLWDLDREEELTTMVVADLSVAPLEGPMAVTAQSPLGQTILGRAPGEEVEVDAPTGPQRYRILDIRTPETG